MRWDGESGGWGRGCWWAADASRRLPRCKRRFGKVTPSRVVPPWLSGAGSDAGHLAQVVTLPLPPRGRGLSRWRVWASSGRRGGERGFGPGPNPHGGIARHCWGRRWPPVASSSRSGFCRKVQPPFSIPRRRLEGPTLVAMWWPAMLGFSVGNTSSSFIHGGLVNVFMEMWSVCSWRCGQCVHGDLASVFMEI